MADDPDTDAPDPELLAEARLLVAKLAHMHVASASGQGETVQVTLTIPKAVRSWQPGWR